MPKNKIVFFDGDCAMCQGWVHWLIQRDTKKQLFFSPINSNLGTKYINKYFKLQAPPDSILFFDGNRIYTHSDAVIEIGSLIPFYNYLAVIFKFIPKFIRNGIYSIIAKNRKHLSKKICRIFTDEELVRFL